MTLGRKIYNKTHTLPTREGFFVDVNKTAYALWKATGVSQQAISRLRSGKKRFEDLSLETVIKIQAWIDEE